MKFLFIFAHPDDETIGCAGTIHKLVQQGDQVKVVLATDGSAGEVSKEAEADVKKLGSLSAVRRQEFKKVCELLQIQDSKILDFVDGEITNQQVWGKLLLTLIDEIDEYKPDVVITFDHTGWYYHLDHVGVSIATTLAVQQSKHQPKVFFHNHFRVDNSKWRYVFTSVMDATHAVDVQDVKDIKFKAMDLHLSQNLNTPRNHMAARENNQELYQLVSATEDGKKWLLAQKLFKNLLK